MSFIQRWDVNDILDQLRHCSAQTSSHYNDGFTAWHCKQDLIRVKYALDEMLESSPHFSVEDKFIEELEQEKTWKKLNAKNP
jgi:hypothetical protein